jgi:hypothetical protein
MLSAIWRAGTAGGAKSSAIRSSSWGKTWNGCFKESRFFKVWLDMKIPSIKILATARRQSKLI